MERFHPLPNQVKQSTYWSVTPSWCEGTFVMTVIPVWMTYWMEYIGVFGLLPKQPVTFWVTGLLWIRIVIPRRMVFSYTVGDCWCRLAHHTVSVQVGRGAEAARETLRR